MEKVGIVVVTYNRLALLKEVIASLREQTYNNFQIIIVNNGSNDGTKEWLSLQKDVHSITQENIGGAGGFFTGMKFVLENGFDYCWVMDDDVICYSNALEELLKAYKLKSDVGFVCSRVLGTDGSAMNTPVVDTTVTSNGYVDLFDYVEPYSMVKVIQSSFVSVLVSTKIIEEIGLPIKEYFIWGDDSEYTGRISKKYSSYIACKSVVVHKRKIQRALSFLEEVEAKRINFYFYMFRNQAYTNLLHKERKAFVKYLIKLWVKQGGSAFVKMKFKHLLIVFKASLALFTFKPVVQFSKRKK